MIKEQESVSPLLVSLDRKGEIRGMPGDSEF